MRIIILVILITSNCFSQGRISDNQFSIDNIAGYYSNLNTWKENGTLGGCEFSYCRKSITYSVNIYMGLGINKNLETKIGYIQAFLESDLLIGKKFQISHSVTINPQIGVAFYIIQIIFKKIVKT